MSQYTLVANDVLYIAFYLKEEDPIYGSITPYDLSSASSIYFRLREYNSSTNALNALMNTLPSPSNTLGYCRVMVTVPSSGTYTSETEVYVNNLHTTWKGPVYIVEGELG
jgi:hypothetical protein